MLQIETTVNNSGRPPMRSHRTYGPAQMESTWTLGVAVAGAENVQHLTDGVPGTRTGAVGAASDALVVAGWIAAARSIDPPGRR